MHRVLARGLGAVPGRAHREARLGPHGLHQPRRRRAHLPARRGPGRGGARGGHRRGAAEAAHRRLHRGGLRGRLDDGPAAGAPGRRAARPAPHLRLVERQGPAARAGGGGDRPGQPDHAAGHGRGDVRPPGRGRRLVRPGRAPAAPGDRRHGPGGCHAGGRAQAVETGTRRRPGRGAAGLRRRGGPEDAVPARPRGHRGRAGRGRRCARRPGPGHDCAPAAGGPGARPRPRGHPLEHLGPARTLGRSEWERVRTHPYRSERILGGCPALEDLAPVAGMHHERLDGSGYHRQAAGSSIPLPAPGCWGRRTRTRP